MRSTPSNKPHQHVFMPWIGHCPHELEKYIQLMLCLCPHLWINISSWDKQVSYHNFYIYISHQEFLIFDPSTYWNPTHQNAHINIWASVAWYIFIFVLIKLNTWHIYIYIYLFYGTKRIPNVDTNTRTWA